MVWFGLVLWPINHCGLFDIKFSLYFTLSIYILNIYCLVWLGLMVYQPLLVISCQILFIYILNICTPMDPHIWPSKKQDGQLEHTYSSYVRIRDVALKTNQRWWTIGRSGERGSGISVLAARHGYLLPSQLGL